MAEGLTSASIVSIKDLSPTIKELRLKLMDPAVSFKAGQWVDFYIPDVTPFTGYSMSSSPELMANQAIMCLAIKYSDYPPTLWVHEKCKVGDTVKVKVAGNFFYSPEQSGAEDDVLLIAGGIGINPIYSILQYFVHINKDKNGVRASLLYSAQTPEELVYKTEILQMAHENTNVQVKLFSTREDPGQASNTYKYGRISEPDLKSAVTTLNTATTQVYICGPPEFIDDMESLCVKEGLQKGNIQYEKWW